MTSSLVVPVIDVHNDNFGELWPAMVVAIKMSSFLALDTELSGLGNRTSLLAACIEDRYKAICHAARSRSILSLGIACYKKLSDKPTDTYLAQVYNITLLCSEEYIIEPQSVQFLVQHGFDFNKQYAQGIPYHKGNNKGGSDNQGVHIRALFTELLRARKPLVLHNGLIDLAFLYQNFYAHLPDRLATFTADLTGMFPAGIYDTKYVTEFELRLSASYLEYAYKKCKLDNSRSESSAVSGRHIQLEFCQYTGTMSRYVDHRTCPTLDPHQTQADVCISFSAFGWCPKGTKCPLSHDTDLIILQDDQSKQDKRKKRKRKKKKEGGDSVSEDVPQDKLPRMELDPGKVLDGHGECADSNMPSLDEENMTRNETACEDNAQAPASDEMKTSEDKKVESGSHRAGFDAFMTGYIFAYACTFFNQSEEATWLPDSLNKIYLSGKATPLNIVNSTFSKSSKAHVQKMEMVWGGKQ
uniref:target of EGR1 protein 1 n=1 Tax=Doryrhamphus excisus TaxID=161450 RepID=UPI0025ADF567|nr:target of EGR1 protein 1 [Doryrhamphus excisus]